MSTPADDHLEQLQKLVGADGGKRVVVGPVGSTGPMTYEQYVEQRLAEMKMLHAQGGDYSGNDSLRRARWLRG